ncbi:hypothetical protein Y032_0009g576 [Ancylostoma ceylanicum]|nr:hypothetical protein Y032_0009g576 [Ancylostoma ceylanicum]
MAVIRVKNGAYLRNPPPDQQTGEETHFSKDRKDIRMKFFIVIAVCITAAQGCTCATRPTISLQDFCRFDFGMFFR